ncbi:hypothetical protein EDC96DRAFT_545541 [Choanephora cucurbitarum]|nr:hypothetical protein EDC96DRAFT_545541 [Choanephora cucurbitarum]
MLQYVYTAFFLLAFFFHQLFSFVQSGYFFAVCMTVLAYKVKSIIVEHFTCYDEVQAEAAETLDPYYDDPWLFSPPRSPEIRPVDDKVIRFNYEKMYFFRDADPEYTRSIRKEFLRNQFWRRSPRIPCCNEYRCMASPQYSDLNRDVLAAPEPTSVVAEVCNAPDDDGTFSAVFIQEMVKALSEVAETSDAGAFSNAFITDMKAALPL